MKKKNKHDNRGTYLFKKVYNLWTNAYYQKENKKKLLKWVTVLFHARERHKGTQVRNSSRKVKNSAMIVTLLSFIHWFYCYPRYYKIGDTFWEILRCFIIINETHKPKIMPINCNNLDVLFGWIILHGYRVDGANLAQRYNNLIQTTSSI